MSEYLMRVIGLHFADKPYRAVRWVAVDDVMGLQALAQGLLAPIRSEDDGVLARITARGLESIGQRLPFPVHGEAA